MQVLLAGDEGECLHLAAVGQRDVHHQRPIDLADHLALVDAVHDVGFLAAAHAVDDAFARAAAVQSQHHARGIGRAPVGVRIDAEGAVIALDAHLVPFVEVELRVPDQRAVGKDPFHPLVDGGRGRGRVGALAGGGRRGGLGGTLQGRGHDG